MIKRSSFLWVCCWRPLMLLIASALAAEALPAAAQDAGGLELRRVQTRAEADRIRNRMALSQERLSVLAEEIGAIKKDNATLTAALIQAAKTEKKLAHEIEDIGRRLADLEQKSDLVRASLQSRRSLLSEVLGALQRMGLNPPPAILVRPEDALSSVRSAILLGAVVPELRVETDRLVSDLGELTRLVATRDAERRRLEATVSDQVLEKRRLSMLLKEKEQLQTRTEAELAEEKTRAAELAEQAQNLDELISALDKELDSARRAVEEARRAEDERIRRSREEAARAVPEENRLVAVPFPALQGRVMLPVAGRLARRFGEDDGNGGSMLGDMVTTQSGAIVTAPADGDVLYAGPFRSYGQLLILDAGNGYHLVLAGMDRTTVVLGQSVLAGEPIGVMGETKLASTTFFGSANAEPELYIEFRKDGRPVDPAPWWAEQYSGRTGNDT